MKDRYWVVVLCVAVGLMTIPIVMARIDLTGTQQRHVFWCEENAAISANMEYSFGNGGVQNWGPCQIYDGWVLGMSLNVDTDTATADSGSVQIAINGAAQGTDYGVGNPGSDDGYRYKEFDRPLRFYAGDRLTAITASAPVGGTTTDVIIAFWVVYDK